MAKFRKKPVVIEAVRWNGHNEDEVFEFGDHTLWRLTPNSRAIKIDTLEGTVSAQVGDWIIRGVHGEYYPCRDDIFQKTYEPVEG